MRLNTLQRKGLADLLGDMAVAIVLGLLLVIFVDGFIQWRTAVIMCVLAILLTVASVYIRKPPGSNNAE